jgi:hypothetical protein
MSKNNSHGNGNAVPTSVHLILQGKGGIGKSVVASWLAEFLIARGHKVCAIDADPINRSLGQYKALKAEKLDLVNKDGLVERNRFDGLLDHILETEMIRILREAGRAVYVHTPISGGEMLNDTLWGFKTLAESAPDKSLVLWINEYFGPVARDGKNFDQMQVYLDNQNKVLAAVGIPQRSSDTFGETIRLMRERKLTFGEAIESPDFMLAQRSRLHIVRRDLFEQIERTPFA